MRFEDEPFIKVYVTDTVTWKMLSWQAQGLLLCLMRKLDRAGIIESKGYEPAKAVAAVLGWPLEVVREHLPELMEGEEPTVVVMKGHVVQPRYLEGQMARQSSSARSRAQRAKKRDIARAQALGIVTQGVVFIEDSQRKDGDNTTLSKQSYLFDGDETERPTSQRDVPSGDTASQNGTRKQSAGTRRDTREERRSDQSRRGGASVVNRSGEPSADDAQGPPETTEPDPIPDDIAQVYSAMDEARRKLYGRPMPQIQDSAALRAAVRRPMAECGVGVPDWLGAIQGQLEDLREKPEQKRKWLSLETLSRPENFLAALSWHRDAQELREARRRQADEERAAQAREADERRRADEVAAAEAARLADEVDFDAFVDAPQGAG